MKNPFQIYLTHFQFYKKNPFEFFRKKIISEIRSQNYPLGPWNRATGQGGRKKCPWKKKDARENSQIFARETVFLPVKKKQKVPVKKKYAREKS